MAILPIIKYPKEILRKTAEPISEISEEIVTLATNMAETMYDAPGIGLAAPQVGVSKRLFVIDLGKDENEEKKSELLTFINPQIIESRGKMKYEEGCLSIPEIREYVERPSWVKVKALSISGQEFELEAEGLLAICIQHELDHLNGVLFIDYLKGLKKKLIAKKLMAFENIK